MIGMARDERVSGRCLCGAVRFTAAAKDDEMGACHCGQCRRWTGGLLFYVSVLPATLKIEGEADLGVYRSSAQGERCFCKLCGSSLIWRRADGTEADVSAQALDDPEQFPLAVEVHCEDKPANYDLEPAARRYAAAEGSAEWRPSHG